MRRPFLFLFAIAAMLACTPVNSVSAADGHARGNGRSHNIGHAGGIGHNGINRGFTALGVGGDYSYGWDIADLYRQLYQNLPYFALHPPVYYSEPVPRTYGYSPFAYGPEVMTPDVVEGSRPVTIDNPYVPLKNASPAEVKTTDRSAAAERPIEPLVIVNPFVAPTRQVANSGS